MDNFSHYATRQIDDIGEIQSFREAAYYADPEIPRTGMEKLISDQWDIYSTHIGLLHGNALVGVVRFCKHIDGLLPVHEACPHFCARNFVHELSRGLIHPDHRRGVGALALAKAIYFYLLVNPGPLVVDMVLRKNASRLRPHILRMGLIDTGIRYWDERYEAESAILTSVRGIQLPKHNERAWTQN
jgi:hypothetical protein